MNLMKKLKNVLLLLFVLQNLRKKKSWIHEINENRESFGEYHTLVNLLIKDANRFHMYFRMSRDQFESLHGKIEERIKKIDTTFRRAICTRERLAVFLRFLATGNSFRSLGFSYKMGFSTVREIIKEVAKAIKELLASEFLPIPTEQRWEEISARYQSMWNFPNCIGALDGKHINIRCPINGGSNYYNYKGCNSIVLLALVDANYRFIAIDVGSYGRNSDGGIFAKSSLGISLANNTLNLPADKPLTQNGEALPHVIVGDEAFPLKSYLLRPYSRRYVAGNEPNKIFNYRLSRARRVVENSFGILAARWRIFLKHMEIQPDFVDDIVYAAICLHNMLCCNNDFEPEEIYRNTLESCFTLVPPLGQNSTQDAFRVRDKFRDYFLSDIGSVPWQLETVRRGRNVIINLKKYSTYVTMYVYKNK
ncbi:uncharacterized protein LOC126749314 isoform X1 [Anthonomus grandis grandis]|uniref:uncharacterized protein LOC126749314 isoform X1 n=2 Tax=Anthonomus grandis grandis TaxID=2921223 RepID=UPI00216501C9|nr:uncharacterized protein LOC126749314 isoform X1 [Anthonomus grandis grandis]